MNKSHEASAKESLLEKIRSNLEPNGWKFRSSSQPPRFFSLTVSHDLSTPVTLTFSTLSTPDEWWSLAKECLLDQREIKVIASRPTEMPHSALIRMLREAGAGNSWSPDIIPVISMILKTNQLITDQEAEWLQKANLAWSKEEEYRETT